MSNNKKDGNGSNLIGWAALLTSVAALLTAVGFPAFFPDLIRSALSKSSLTPPKILQSPTEPPKTSLESASVPLDGSIDYTLLKNLLSAGNWEEANSTTLELMLKAAGREKNGYIESMRMRQFPCKDLLTIERLWSEASDGKFGFKAQYDIWKQIGGEGYRMGSDYVLFDRFVATVKWDEDRIFAIEAPKGHLPVFRNGGKIGGIASTYRIIECTRSSE
jgi:hypothetical protein